MSRQGRMQQLKNFLLCVRECGALYAMREALIRFGLLDLHPANGSEYEEWEKEDKKKRLIERAANWNEFVSQNGNIVNLSEETILNLRNGMQIYVRPQSVFNTDLHVIYETILRKDYGTVSPNEVVIDVGAYIGDFTAFAAHSGAVVYAFEPSVESFRQLLKNIKLMKSSSVRAFNAAIVPHSCTGKRGRLVTDGINLGASRIVFTSGSTEGFECTSLRNVFDANEIEKCDLLKIDCEGLEFEILESLESRIYAKVQRIVLEFHNGCPKKLEKLRRKLEGEGFFVQTLISPYSRIEGILYCWKKT